MSTEVFDPSDDGEIERMRGGHYDVYGDVAADGAGENSPESSRLEELFGDGGGSVPYLANY
jgi:hypothetical protein